MGLVACRWLGFRGPRITGCAQSEENGLRHVRHDALAGMTKRQKAPPKRVDSWGMSGSFSYPVVDFFFGLVFSLNAVRFWGRGLGFGVVLVDFVCDVFEADVDFVDAFELLYGFGAFAAFFEDDAQIVKEFFFFVVEFGFVFDGGL